MRQNLGANPKKNRISMNPWQKWRLIQQQEYESKHPIAYSVFRKTIKNDSRQKQDTSQNRKLELPIGIFLHPFHC